MLWLGTMMRIAAYGAILACDRDMRSKPSFSEIYIKDVLQPLIELISEIWGIVRGGLPEVGKKKGEGEHLAGRLVEFVGEDVNEGEGGRGR